jgi:hypothetical protein
MNRSFDDIARTVLSQIPPVCRFSDKDARLISDYNSLLLTLEPELVQGFYDVLLAHEATRSVFAEGERPDREATLRHWWRRTVNGPFDDEYWAWQALVGLVHVKRGVKNAMMIGMWRWLLTWLGERLAGMLEEREAQELLDSFGRLASTVQALTAESYMEHYLATLLRMTGFKEALLKRLISVEIDRLLDEKREAWISTTVHSDVRVPIH